MSVDRLFFNIDVRMNPHNPAFQIKKRPTAVSPDHSTIGRDKTASIFRHYPTKADWRSPRWIVSLGMPHRDHEVAGNQ